MKGLTDTILQMMDTTPDKVDYTGEDGLLYCGKCHKPKEAYFPKGRALFGRDRVIFPLAGQFCFQSIKFRIREENIMESPISGGGGRVFLSLSLFLYLFISLYL